jgi:aminopeptidase N
MLNFDGISYAKGASALRQLVTWLGEKDFLAGINTHFARHKFANATLADFIDNLASATERDVHAWADSWLRTTGVDTLTPTLTAGPDGTHTLTVEHHGSRPHRIAVGLYDNDLGGEGRLTLRDRLEADVPGTEPTVIGKRPALLLLNDGDLSYAKVRFDPESFQAVRTALAGLPEPLTRAVVWNALRDAVRDGELPAMAYIDAARAHLPHESDLALVQGVLSFATAQVADRYLPAEDRPTALATLTDLCRDLIRRTEDGSHPGLRLTAVRHYIDVAAHPDTISAWFSEGTVPGGPELDPELRWRILGRLAVLGAIDDAVIEAELVQDPSATGQEGAARCRAALPDPEAKRRAWEEMFISDHLSNYLFTATAQGFWQPEQTQLVREYVERYWTDAVAVAARRGPAIADAAGRYAFPVHAVTPETLALGEACLRDADLIPALRRKLVDQLDDLARALRVRTA